LQSLPLNDEGRERCVLSVGQFRPEKDHALQVRALAALKKLSNAPRELDRRYTCFDDVRLVILGSCRNDDDREVLARTRALAVELGVEDRVEFVVNCSFDELKGWLGRASVGIHTMWNEHFGIGVVEMMAAGLVTIAHWSGGPAEDIIVPIAHIGMTTGFLAKTPEGYAHIMAGIFHVWREPPGPASHEKASKIPVEGVKLGSASAGPKGRGFGLIDGRCRRYSVRVAARMSASRFSNEVFDREFSARFARLLQPQPRTASVFSRQPGGKGKEE
ncbi:unnamed protein product, partial [Laminaria digitata]